MHIELLYFAGCPAVEAAAGLLDDVLSAEGIDAAVSRIQVPGPEAIAEHRFIGSPTIRINGVDLEGGQAERELGYGWRCRLYGTSQPGQPRSVPAADLIRTRVREEAKLEDRP